MNLSDVAGMPVLIFVLRNNTIQKVYLTGFPIHWNSMARVGTADSAAGLASGGTGVLRWQIMPAPVFIPGFFNRYGGCPVGFPI